MALCRRAKNDTPELLMPDMARLTGIQKCLENYFRQEGKLVGHYKIYPVKKPDGR